MTVDEVYYIVISQLGVLIPVKRSHMQKRIFILQLRASLVLYYFPEGGYHASNMNKMQLELLVKNKCQQWEKWPFSIRLITMFRLDLSRRFNQQIITRIMFLLAVCCKTRDIPHATSIWQTVSPCREECITFRSASTI